MEDGSPLVIAIDGPAGAGKSTVSKLLADRLGLFVLDTGAMYRCLAIKALREGLPTDDAPAMERVARSATIGFGPGQPQRVFLDGADVTEAIRSPEAGQAASELSVHAGVRRVLVEEQKRFVSRGGCVLEGRDTTTVVAPGATVKVFLTASVEERARRRWLEARAKGSELSLQAVVLDVVSRDYRDYTRKDSPLALDEEAVIVESFGVTPPQVVERIVRLVEAAAPDAVPG